ncbi:MAG: type II toxin-antitoxin system RelE family toxin [Angustibacter sp.]
MSWTSPAQRDLQRLPPRIIDAILIYAQERLAINPALLSKPLDGQFHGRRSARNGDYRLIISISESEEIAFIHRVHHRAHIYRPQ